MNVLKEAENYDEAKKAGHIIGDDEDKMKDNYNIPEEDENEEVETSNNMKAVKNSRHSYKVRMEKDEDVYEEGINDI